MPLIPLLFLLSALSPAADWPQWRGPNRTAISTESGLLQSWPSSGPALLWQATDLGEGYATPIVAGNHIYLIANEGLDNEYIEARSTTTGKRIWRTRLGNVGNPNQQPPYPMARSTPALNDGRLYALGSDGDLVSLDPASGKIHWRQNLRSAYQGIPGKWAYAESPLIDNDRIIVTPGGPTATLVALRKTTGDLIWKSAVPNGDPAAYASAIAITAAGRRQYVQFLDKGVVGVDAANGQFLWRYDKTSTGPANIATPISSGNFVYSTNARRFGAALVQLHPAGDTVRAEEVYFERDAPNTLGGQVLHNGTLYGTNQKGLAAIDFLTGKLKWQSDADGPAAILLADSRLYLHTENGEVILADANPNAYSEKGRFRPTGQPKHTRNREMSWSYPIVANGRLYIRDQGVLWCYDIKAR